MGCEIGGNHHLHHPFDVGDPIKPIKSAASLIYFLLNKTPSLYTSNGMFNSWTSIYVQNQGVDSTSEINCYNITGLLCIKSGFECLNSQARITGLTKGSRTGLFACGFGFFHA
ncbi:hypothetical protein L2E82_08150 [Cichorium intybus]|uniref:Uncharacterized protein n=1 Tax=Cichorium intybus TaxID=13427 RepID=A0ACB9G6V3_CICIN|nr:hypothetical protein L2E82_08150 [Cichorium intybus]